MTRTAAREDTVARLAHIECKKGVKPWEISLPWGTIEVFTHADDTVSVFVLAGKGRISRGFRNKTLGRIAGLRIEPKKEAKNE